MPHLTRRHLLTRTAALTAAAALSPLVYSAEAGAPNDRLRVGIIFAYWFALIWAIAAR